MGKITFDLNELYRKAFGPVAPPYPIGDRPDPMDLLPVKKITGGTGSVSKLGAPLHMEVFMSIPGVENSRYKLPNEPIVSISGSKEKEITTVSRGRKRGSVKEKVNLNSYKINIRGIIINEEDNEYPDEVIRRLRRLIENPGAIVIDTYTCRLWNIGLAVVNNFRFPRDFDTQLRWCWYEINLTSDEDFELEFLNQ